MSSRSNGYQYKFKERLRDVTFEENRLTIGELLNDVSNEFKELRYLLMDRIYELCELMPEEDKKSIRGYFFEGMTQTEIADGFKQNQTSIHKRIFGQVKREKGKKVRTGAIGRLRKLCLKDEVVKKLLEQMQECE